MSTNGTTPAVTLERLERRFGELIAVKGIDLEIAEGEFFSLIGPSGCGKTTTLRMIAGLEEPSSGRVLVRGADMTCGAGQQAAGQHRVPALRAVPAPGRVRERGLRPARGGGGPRTRCASGSPRIAGAGRAARARAGAAAGAVGRPAAAGGARPLAGAGAAGAAAGRAAGRARPEAAPPDAGGAEGAAAARSASPSSTSPTTRRRRSRCRIGSAS